MLLADLLYGDVMAVTLSIIGFFLLAMQGLWLLCLALWPARVAEATLRCQDRPVASFFIGVVVTLVGVVIGGSASRAGGAPGQMLGFSILFLYIIFSGIGLSGFVTHIGKRLPSPGDAQRPWRATVRGGIVLQLACLIPLLGWFGILPISLILGTGAATMSLLSRRSRQAPSYNDAIPHSPIDELPRGAQRAMR